ncbi:putative protein serine/threonine kinase [Tieghemostelium lacteum]|uniref:Protein kinase domain-containing protein n=1 Tax=Tieghemostelium lacteum TaxID=361077 RepID=A0A152A0A3_TIELA|nr:putative protein serine/threonine kinase [Tieghemostelium lacteum]|eukprot:KYQ99639.1 putative protein serine/threonine kinase [Tieghemostelium lacteum]
MTLPTSLSIPLSILCLYIVIVVLSIVIAFLELKNHRASWNSLKILFYCLIILQSLCRGIMIGWGLLKNIEGGEFYSNFPALLFISFSGILGLQMYQFSLKDQDYQLLDSRVAKKKNHRLLKIGTNTLIAFNTVMYASNFLLFGIAERDNGNSTTIHNHSSSSSPPSSSSHSIDSTSIDSFSESSSSSSIYDELSSKADTKIYVIIQIFYISCLGFLLVFHSIIGWKSFKRFKLYFGGKLNILHLIFMICILSRIVLLIFDPTSKKSSILHFQMTNRSILTFTMFYFTFGEIIPSLLSLYIQYLLPNHQLNKLQYSENFMDDMEQQQHSDNSSNGSSIGSNRSNNNSSSTRQAWDNSVIIQDKIGIGASGAEVFLCNLRGATFAVKIMKDAVSFDRENFLKEIEIYKSLPKSSNLLEYKGTSKSNQQIKLYMEYMPFTLAKYIDTRLKCGGDTPDDSKKIFKNYLLYQNRGTKQKSKPFYFQYEQSVGILYLISIALELLHKHKIAHGDLKTDNIFLLLKDTEIHQIKLGDFNQSIRSPTSSDIQKEIYQFGLVIFDILNLSNQSCLKDPNPPNINLDNIYYSNDQRYQSLLHLYQLCILTEQSDKYQQQQPSSTTTTIKSMTDIKSYLSDLHKQIIETKGILKF